MCGAPAAPLACSPPTRPHATQCSGAAVPLTAHTPAGAWPPPDLDMGCCTCRAVHLPSLLACAPKPQPAPRMLPTRAQPLLILPCSPLSAHRSPLSLWSPCPPMAAAATPTPTTPTTDGAAPGWPRQRAAARPPRAWLRGHARRAGTAAAGRSTRGTAAQPQARRAAGSSLCFRRALQTCTVNTP